MHNNLLCSRLKSVLHKCIGLQVKKDENPERAFIVVHTLALLILCSPPSHAHDAHDARPGDQSARWMKGKEIKVSPSSQRSSRRQRSVPRYNKVYIFRNSIDFLFSVHHQNTSMRLAAVNPTPPHRIRPLHLALQVYIHVYFDALSNRLQVTE